MREGCYGLRPEDFHDAYSLPEEAPTRQTIAIVGEFSDPFAEQDLKQYDREFKLPACTLSNNCFRQVDQEGKRASLHEARCISEVGCLGWALEASLDIEVAHAICQNCHILLVEARPASGLENLEVAENQAVASGATEISNSWVEKEPVIDSPAFDHPGVVITAATGDEGYLNWTPQSPEKGLVGYPASSPHVIAVGGTRLYATSGTWTNEIVWNGAGVDGGPVGATGGGCSEHFLAPYWQQELRDWTTTGCSTKRATADIAADGDPFTGAAIYAPNEHGVNGWETVGGTSLSSPLIAAAFALAGGGSGVEYPARTLYENESRVPASLHDIESGSNGSCGIEPLAFEQLAACTVLEEGAICSEHAICVAGPGYDGPSGVGTPDGLGAFHATGAPAKKPQLLEFTSAAPKTARLGGPEYTPTATASSGLPVSFSSTTQAACLLKNSDVTFVGAGTCTIDADQPGDGEYQTAPQIEQSFPVGEGTQVIAFTSPPPSSASVGGPSYSVSAVASSGLQVFYGSTTPTVCSIEGQTVEFLRPGTCTIEASQPGDSEYQAAPVAQQSFAVQMPESPALQRPQSPDNSVTKRSETSSFTSSNPLVAPIATFTMAATPRPNHITGAITFAVAVGEPGTLRWLLTFPTESLDVPKALRGRCPKGEVMLGGGCRPSRTVFAKGKLSIDKPGSFALIARPSEIAMTALRAASQRTRGLPVLATFTFMSRLGGRPSSQSRTVLDRLTGSSAHGGTRST